MFHRSRLAFVCVLMVGLWQQPAWAGMPSIGFYEIARLRLEVISFFFVGLLISAAVVQGVWNSLRRDFIRLPRLTYGRACGIVVLWGLLFVVVLTMISGARELMTPGAWEKTGVTYKLKEAPPSAESSRSDPLEVRRRKLEHLGRQLMIYASQHDGRFPTADEEQSAIAADAWDLPDLEGTRYVYIPGRSLTNSGLIVAYEPTIFDGEPFALLANGEVLSMKFELIGQLVGADR